MTQVESKQLKPTAPNKTFRILYADDMAELRKLMELSLARDGHTVVSVADGRPALEMVRANPAAFDIVITDHHMTDVNGLELVTKLRELAYPGKIIVFSSELSKEIGEAYQELRVDAVLYKPVMPGVLRHLLQDL
jgi:two-component system chemotaxis response regulator CheY